MVGRNDPCPCGSGKKFKKCCASKEAVTIDVVQMEELDRILQNFYEEYPERKDYQALLKVVDEWKHNLDKYLPEEMVEAIALDEFFFHHKLEIWRGYVDKTKKKIVRPGVLSTLEKWQNPKAFIGKVKAVSNSYMTCQSIFDEEEIQLKRESKKPVPVDVHMYCFILPDDSGMDNHYLAVSSLIFIPTDHTDAIEQFVSATGEQESSVPINEMTLAFWKQLGEDGFEGGEFTDFEAGVLLEVVHFLKNHDRDPYKLLDFIEDFLVEQQPNARKEAAIAAGAVRFGQESGFFEPLPMTLKEIADAFSVSTSSMNKYAKELAEYVR